MIRLAVPSIAEDDLQAVSKVLRSGFLVQGAHVADFEQSVAQYVGAKYAVAVSNGTAALHLSLLSLGVGSGDLVVVTAYSYVATANAIELCGARPVFVDIQPDTFNMDPDRLADVLEGLLNNPETAGRVKGIIPVHTFGQVANMPAIRELADRYDLPIIEDAACALGAKLAGTQAGSWSVLGCFSFHPRKAITTGEGGIITTSDLARSEHLRALRNHGQDPNATTPDFILPGFNYRMTEFQAALGMTQLTKLERLIATRRSLAATYDRLLSDTVFRTPVLSAESESVYQSYVVLLPAEVAAYRAELIQKLKAHGVETTIGTWHMPLTTYFRRRYGYSRGDFPVTDDVFERSLTLPLHDKLLPSEQSHVVRSLHKAVCEILESS